MHNRDEVIRHAACVVANHGRGVGRALSAYLSSSGGTEREALRGELVALSEDTSGTRRTARRMRLG